jgi:hypothetical protein
MESLIISASRSGSGGGTGVSLLATADLGAKELNRRTETYSSPSCDANSSTGQFL